MWTGVFQQGAVARASRMQLAEWWAVKQAHPAATFRPVLQVGRGDKTHKPHAPCQRTSHAAP